MDEEHRMKPWRPDSQRYPRLGLTDDQMLMWTVVFFAASAVIAAILLMRWLGYA